MLHIILRINMHINVDKRTLRTHANTPKHNITVEYNIYEVAWRIKNTS